MLGRRQEGFFPERIDASTDEVVLKTEGLCLKKRLNGVELED